MIAILKSINFNYFIAAWALTGSKPAVIAFNRARFLFQTTSLLKNMHLQWGYRGLLEGQVLEIADWQWVEIRKWQWWCSQVPSSDLAVGAIDNAPSSPTTTTTILVRPRSPLLGSFWLNTMPRRHLERPWAILWLVEYPLKYVIMYNFQSH